MRGTRSLGSIRGTRSLGVYARRRVTGRVKHMTIPVQYITGTYNFDGALASAKAPGPSFLVPF